MDFKADNLDVVFSVRGISRSLHSLGRDAYVAVTKWWGGDTMIGLTGVC